MAYCPSCGKEVSPEAVFCPSCGHQLAQSQPAVAPAPQVAKPTPGQAAFDPYYEVLDFEIMNEAWNEYELVDGSHMRARTILWRLWRRRTLPAGQVGFSAKDIINVTTSPEKRGIPSPLTPEENSGPIQGHWAPVKTAKIDEKWNEYRILKNDEKIGLKFTLVDVFRVPDRYDANGEPWYKFRRKIEIRREPKKAAKLD